ncbi:alginate O-acetyltransferase [Rhodopseudomonas sp. BR0G17]|uniref:alginate O-acetyltransferase AlgX-related protein n=1 Tax=Rhodopseudomonas sp. BR0G17 TaxID=2269368 RepID=UPI0013E0DAD6|nr:alginate O-acetyltransferase [Rhodopseudomonas sp. BR0G17]NEW95434.1 alginate O-acetyltransferase [Rhodopseudomonas sp. BR0G17]
MQRTPFTVRLYCGALVGLVAAFSFASLIAMTFKHAEISIGEKRALTQLPEWPRTAAQWDSFPERFDAYFNDNFGLRKLLLRLNSNFTTVMLGRSPSDKVVFGKDDWLFYAGDNSIELYRNQHPFSTLQLANTEAALALRMRPLQAAGRPYLFVVVPDKHTIYPEMMPSFMSRRDPPSQLDQVVAMAEAARLPVLDLRATLRQGKTDGQVYLKDDSHWTDWGAYLGYRRIMAALPLTDLPVLDLDATKFAIPSDHAGDLAGMAGLTRRETTRLSELPADRCAFTATAYQPVGDDISIGRTFCPQAKYKIMFIGDSFTGALVKYLSRSFGEVVYVARSGFKPSREIAPLIEREKPDLVIEELAERHLDSLADTVAQEGR